MAPARAVFAALLLVAVSAAAPASGQLGPRRLVVYPVAAAATAAGSGDAGDVASLLDAALHRVVQRTDEVALGDPLVSRAACGGAQSASAQCLAGLSGGGLVLRVTVHRAQTLLVVQLEAVDGKARPFGPVTVSIDAYAQSAEPLMRGVLILVEQAAGASRAPDLRAAGPSTPLPPPPIAVAKREAPAAAPAPAPRAWMRTAGPWLTTAGAAILAGGLALSTVNRSLSNELDRKFAAGTLTPADLASYDRVKRYDRLSQGLFLAGGAFTLSGVALWTAAPERGGASAGVAGRF